MELEHSFTVPVPPDRAWEVLLDVERVAPCMPGATLDSVDGDVIAGRIKVKVGPIAMTYAGTARFTERDDNAHVVTLTASGKETRGAGTASAAVRSTLTGQGDSTRVTVHTTLNITGKPAQFGRGVMAEVGGKLIGIFAANLAEMLAANGAASGAAGGAAAGTAGGAAAAAVAGQAVPDAGPRADPAVSLDELNLPPRARNSLREAGLRTVADLAARSPDELLAIENVGPATVKEVRRQLAERGLSLSAAAAAPDGTGVTVPAPGETPLAAAEPPAPEPAPSGRDAGRLTAAEPDHDDAIDLLSVAGMPMLKRAIPVLAGLTAAVLVVIRVRYRRRRRRG